MNPNPNKRQEADLQKKGEKIGEILNLEKVPLYNMAWKEDRLKLLGGGECYPLIDVLERMAEMLGKISEEPKKRPGRPPKDKQ